MIHSLESNLKLCITVATCEMPDGRGSMQVPQVPPLELIAAQGWQLLKQAMASIRCHHLPVALPFLKNDLIADGHVPQV